MKDPKKKITVKNQRGLKAGIISNSSLLIECLIESISFNNGVALKLS